tara:strand:+ start:1090 stop:2391 length:1302 start_codon:yes stop_codon:yes gene_type:complete
MAESNFIINESKSLLGNVNIPGDKSITHRAIMLSSLSNDSLVISNALLGEDCLKTIASFSELGVKITHNDNNLKVCGNGLLSLTKPKKILDCGNSGTLARLMAGILSVQKFESTISGDDSLSSRPMDRIIKPLEEIGSKISSKKNLLPITFYPQKSLKPINYINDIASAQIKSCLILASLFISGKSSIYETTKTRDHTERLLEFLEYPIKVQENNITILGQGKLIARDIYIPSDFSSASFFIIAALIKPGSNLDLKNIGINEYRTGLIDVLIKMGASIKLANKRDLSNEPIADINIKHSKLKPINISGTIISRMIDELPILFIACALCEGESIISDISELRVKESDRIESMENGLRAIGIDVTSTKDSISIKGGSFKGGIIDSNHDHRIAMSFIVAGLVSQKPITVLNAKNIATSFPGFINILKKMGVEIYKV